MTDVVIRRVSEDDDLEEITRIVHAAYKALSDMGLRFWATFQSVDDTRQRFSDGYGFVALIGDVVVGTITIYGPKEDSDVDIYRDPHTFGLGQFAVDPSCQGAGIGRLLHNAALHWIASEGGKRVALDTADQAVHLIALYTKWGYRIAGRADWRPMTNYESVVMIKEIDMLSRHG